VANYWKGVVTWGRNGLLRRQTHNIIDEHTMRMEAVRKKETEEQEEKTMGSVRELPPVLARFGRRGD
jgi:hypothetical protein